MGADPSIDTKEQILNVAEHMIAERGFAGTTLRSVVSKAGVNLAAVHYHFGSKEELFRATVERIARPVVEQELAGLRRLQQEKESPSVEEILTVFLVSPLKLLMGYENSRRVRAQFMGRCRTEPEPVQSIATKEFDASSQAFLEALQRALPNQSRAQLQWKFDLAITSLVRVQMEVGKPGALIQSTQPEDIQEAVSQLVKFLAEGMRA
ncbi:MAG: TetR family transcriptional regulator [Leptolyngbya sp. SIO1E4]|nr:TetR family transcriptional regulator [Leptolyngbya sp. SIO1E4]